MDPNGTKGGQKGAKREPKGCQTGAKGEPKESQREPKGSKGSPKCTPKSMLRKSDRKRHDRLVQMGQFLDPFWHRKSLKNHCFYKVFVILGDFGKRWKNYKKHENPHFFKIA